MTAPGNKRLKIVLGAVCIGLLVFSGALFWKYSLLKVRTKWANEQTKIFEEMRARALKNDSIPNTALSLEYIVKYYPSGTKQEPGSQLNEIVERARGLAIQDIVASLRTNASQDLGENPEAWIQKYGLK